MKSKDTNKCLYQNMNQVDKLKYYVVKKENLRRITFHTLM